jgi:hypothetical protein
MKKSQIKHNTDLVLDMVKSNGVYIRKEPFFLKQWWSNYLNRLNKVTHGKSQCCK